MTNTLINIGMYLAYLAFGISIVLLLVFAIKGLFTNGKNSKNTLIGVAVLVAIVLVAYLLSPAETGDFYTRYGVSPQQVKIISAGLVTTYIIGGLLVVLTVVTAVVKLFKK